MNWIRVSAGLKNFHMTALLVFADGYGDTDIFAGTYGVGMFRSTDNGASWSAVSVNPPAIGSPNYSNAFAVSDSDIFGGRFCPSMSGWELMKIRL